MSIISSAIVCALLSIVVSGGGVTGVGWGRGVQGEVHVPDGFEAVDARGCVSTVRRGEEGRGGGVLVAVDVARDLVLHAQRDTVKLPCHLRRVAALVQGRREGRGVLYVTMSLSVYGPQKNIVEDVRLDKSCAIL